jgi:hypothetical protein
MDVVLENDCAAAWARGTSPSAEPMEAMTASTATMLMERRSRPIGAISA